jgi:NAD+ synthase (glutamine-hydrolysing)
LNEKLDNDFSSATKRADNAIKYQKELEDKLLVRTNELQEASHRVVLLQNTVASVDVDKVRSKRATTSSSSIQASKAELLPIIKIDFSLIASPEHQRPTPKKNIFYNTPEQEISFGPACWMWDYLRRSGGGGSGGGGFFLPLSGGADSAATASMVGIMCQLVFAEIQKGNEEILSDLRRVVKTPDFMPTSHKQIANRILHTCYMGTANSSDATRARAAALAEQIGAFHKEAPIDTMVMAGLHVVGSFVSLSMKSFLSRIVLY